MQRPSFASLGPYAAVGIVTLVVAIAALDARATYGARVTADEPQYLLTALSLAEDRDLDISDEIDDRRYLPFHEIRLDQQTIELNDEGLPDEEENLRRKEKKEKQKSKLTEALEEISASASDSSKKSKKKEEEKKEDASAPR